MCVCVCVCVGAANVSHTLHTQLKQKEYVVQDITGHKDKAGVRQFVIHYECYSAAHDELLDAQDSYSDVIDAYEVRLS